MCEAFQRTVGRAPDRVALRTLSGGWRLTYRELDQWVRSVAAGLHELGLRRGDALALMMGNRPEFHVLDLAAMHLGAVPFSIYATSSAPQMQHIVENAGARLAVVERPSAHRVPVAEVLDVEDLVAVEAAGAHGPGIDFDACWRAVEPDDLLTLIYTSGTTGPAKGVEVTHANELATAYGYHAVVGFPEGADVVSYLPMAHIAERNCSHYWAQVFGFTVTVCPDPGRVFEHVRDARPAWFFAVPRVFEKLRAAVMADAGVTLREAIARATARRLGEDGPEPDPEPLRIVRERIGLDRVQAMLVGGTAVPADLIRFYHALGLPLGEIWAMSETTGLGTCNRPFCERVGTAGPPAPGVELRLAQDGEIEVRGPMVSPGYRGMPQATAESRTGDGWLRTGDIGTLDEEGCVSIVDRKKELIISSAGKNMSPSNIESELKAAAPLIGSAVAIGDARAYNVALLVLDPDAAGAFAREHGLAAQTLAELAAAPAVLEAVSAGVASANARLSRPEQIKRFALLGEEWLPGGEELTPTMKLRRKPIAEKYAAEIERLYAGPGAS
jgi:long-chain acyl-CoA synthetase